MSAPFSFDMLLTFAVLAGVLALFTRDAYPPHLVAMGALAVLLAAGVIDTPSTLALFGNPATATIACMFILSAALERTGVIDLLGRGIMALAEKRRFGAVAALMAGVAAVSAFMNNTPVVIVMAPVVIAVARQLQDSPSKYLIPLSYMAILGGTCTLIGTSTNILTDGIATAQGMEPFSMFEISGPGIAMAAVGALFLATIGRRLLPTRDTLQAEILAGEKGPHKRFLAEAVVPPGSPLIGKTLNEVRFSSEADYEVLDLIRNDSGARNNGFANLMQAVRELRGAPTAAEPARPRSTLRDIPLQAGDRLVFKTDQEELLEIRESTGISFETGSYAALPARETTLAEGVIGPNSRFAGQTPSELRLRRRHGSYILAVHRDQRNITANFDSFRLRHGDVLLLEGPQEEIDRLFAQEDVLPITQVTHRPVHKVKAAIATAAVLGVAGLAALEVMPIAGLAIPGAMLVILTGCVSPGKAYEAIEWRILMLIFGMLGVSLAMEKSGAARLVVETAANLVQDFGPLAVLATVYFLTSLLTEVMSNNATAVLMTPIVIGVAQQTGIEARPLVVAVMLGASASFATPIGYQTNTYVYNIGNYRFGDFLRIGVPMNLLMLVVAVAVIPLFWPL
ncbi:SLC13 family permease [Oleispirillum naphthae]|uniref:SLC13 family permease n=1 Tax=Oleispirillum naphthae TaxID=2838853 RepID=UPI00308245F5